MASWQSLLVPATDSDLKRTAPRGGKTAAFKFAEAAQKQLDAVDLPANERPKRLWWFTNKDQKVVFRARHGSNYVNLQPGHSAFLLDNEDAIGPLLAELIEAAKGGELDDVLKQATNKASAPAPSPAKRGRGRK